MKSTRYFKERVLFKRTYLKEEWCKKAIKEYIKKEIQEKDKRIRFWIFLKEEQKYLRVVTLEDGETVHNAFFDRSFKEDKK